MSSHGTTTGHPPSPDDKPTGPSVSRTPPVNQSTVIFEGPTDPGVGTKGRNSGTSNHEIVISHPPSQCDRLRSPQDASTTPSISGVGDLFRNWPDFDPQAYYALVFQNDFACKESDTREDTPASEIRKPALVPNYLNGNQGGSNTPVDPHAQRCRHGNPSRHEDTGKEVLIGDSEPVRSQLLASSTGTGGCPHSPQQARRTTSAPPVPHSEEQPGTPERNQQQPLCNSPMPNHQPCSPSPGDQVCSSGGQLRNPQRTIQKWNPLSLWQSCAQTEL